MLKGKMNINKSKVQKSAEIFDVDKFFRGYLLLDIAVGVCLSEKSNMFSDEQKECLEVFWSNAPSRCVPPVEDVLAYFRQKELNEQLSQLEK